MKIHRWRLWKAVILAATATLAVTAAVYAFGYQLNGVPNVQQERSKWCWAASGKSVLQYFGKSVSQCGFYKSAKNKPWYYVCTSSDDVGGSVFDVQNGLNNNGVTTQLAGSLSWDQVVDEISNKFRPFVAYWRWYDQAAHSEAGHMVVGKAWERTDCNGDGILENLVGYMDPKNGWFVYLEYSEFSWTGDHSWDGTVLTRNVQ